MTGIPNRATAWAVENRSGSGIFVVSQDHNTLLFRIDPRTMTIYPYDKKAKCEIGIALTELACLSVSSQTILPMFSQPVTTLQNSRV